MRDDPVQVRSWTRPPITVTDRIEKGIAVLLISCGIWLAAHRAFWYFAFWDDEGYLLRSLISFVTHGGLYTRTYAQYGPFFYFAQQWMHSALHLPYTHDGARTLTLIYWLASAALSALFVHVLTRRILVTSLAFLATLLVSVLLTREPGHPQEVILLLTFFALCMSTAMKTRWRNLAEFALGSCAACICLTKINVGLFFVAALVLAASFCLRPGMFKRVLLSVCSAAALLLPVALMREHLEGATARYCLLATLSIAVWLFAAAQSSPAYGWPVRRLLFILSGFVTVSLAVIAISVAQGSSLATLMKGVILDPLHHPKVFFLPITVHHNIIFVSLVLFIFAVAVTTSKSKWFAHRYEVGLVKSAIGLFGLLITFSLSWAPYFVLPLAWLPCWQTRRAANEFFPRLFLGGILVFEFLQAYPVAGSQLAIASAPAVAWGCVLLSDGVADLRQPDTNLFVLESVRRHKWLAQTLLAILIGAGLFRAARLRDFGWSAPGPPLNLVGAKKIRVPPNEARMYRQLVANIRTNCDVLFSLPGLFSLNLWSEIPTPDDFNLTGWMTAFTPEMQEDILSDLLKHKRPCIVYNPAIVGFWMKTSSEPLSNSPLANYIFSDTRPIFTVGQYQLRIPGAPPSNVR